MKTTIRKRTYQAIYRLLGSVNPLESDCGQLCGSACCVSTEANMGIYLLPGEEKLYTRQETWLRWDVDDVENYDFPDSWHGKIYFVHCLNAPLCPRELRPLQCRFFPLAPHLESDGKLVLILYPSELPYSCPLIRDKMPLSPRYIKAVHTVWRRLIQDPLIFDLIRYDSSMRSDKNLIRVYAIP